MSLKMDRSAFSFHKMNESSESDKTDLLQMKDADKIELITRLRECFYGPEATTGRLYRFSEFVKLQ